MLATLVAGCLLSGSTEALTTIFFEDFEGLQLRPPEQENGPFPRAFTHVPPPGWFRDASDVPGVGTPSVGIFEWEGWSFADKDFWRTVTRPTPTVPTPRDRFTFGQGTIAVADPDRWNDLGDPANQLGFYNTLLRTRPIDLTPATGEERLRLRFDSSWRGGCCDDGGSFNPNGNNQTALVNVVVGTQTFEVLRWESAPYYDVITQKPTTQPFASTGQPNLVNAAYRPDNFNEQVVIDLSALIPNPSGQAMGFANSMSGEDIVIEFIMEGAGDDGWWAFDDVEMGAYSTLLADMNFSGHLDTGDYGDFALGMLDEEAYRLKYFGEYPETNGSLDSTFDFDDVPWFLSKMTGVSPEPSLALAAAFAQFSVPEPGTATLVLSVLLIGGFGGVRGREQ
ncbi:hypothetical protein Pla111_21020 [Botrimarina hoheduenensis]|uniref:PEP-CTERM protein-sorting domain-containing protein n=2 Tax=Botrimarina hoheduenensis TaxID=2528000 RepID=A0A5C5W065_9BACT|nr:hypothetical protein Pla111_21020 [Botrimarina hoheduenensis]